MRRGRLGGAGLLLGVLAGALPGSAAVYTVTHLNDSWTIGDGCSLREAIRAHNAAGGGTNDCGVFDAAGDTIGFAPGVIGTLRLDPALGELVINQPALTIQGPGAAQLSISGSKQMSVLVLDLLHPPSLTVRALTLRDGLGKSPTGGWDDQGGGIRMQLGGSVLAEPTSIVLEDVVLFANSSPLSGASRGAAILSYGKLVMTRTTVRANQSDLGAVWHEGTALIQDSEFTDNAASFVFGAVVLSGSGPWTVRRSLFLNNVAISNGYTGIVFLSNTGNGLVENCTFVGNHSDTGGVIGSQSPVTVNNSTFFGNYATGQAGTDAVIGVYASNLKLSSNLFGKHEIKDLWAYTAAGATIHATRNQFDSTAASMPPGVLCAPTTSGGLNLCGVVASGAASLANNGGPTLTMALLPGSPAINAGENLGSLTTDQRGPGFPRQVGAATDIGAFERQ